LHAVHLPSVMISGTNLMSQKVHVLSVESHDHGFSLHHDRRNINELVVPLCSHPTFFFVFLVKFKLVFVSSFTIYYPAHTPYILVQYCSKF